MQIAEFAEKEIRRAARILRRRRGVSVQQISNAGLEEIGTPCELHISANVADPLVVRSAWRAYRRAVARLGAERVTFALPNTPARKRVAGKWRTA